MKIQRQFVEMRNPTPFNPIHRKIQDREYLSDFDKEIKRIQGEIP